MTSARPFHTPALGLLTTCLMAAAMLTLGPASAAAQKTRFVDAFVRFHSALAGTYGDEGPVLQGALDEMAASLATWDADTAAVEARSSAPSDLGLVYLDRGRLEDALTAFDAAIRADPKRGALHRFRGVILDALGRTPDAIGAFTTAWQLDNNDVIAAYLLGDRSASDTDDAALDPIAAALTTASSLAPAGGRPLASPFVQLALVEDAAASTPIFAPSLYAGAFTLVMKGRYTEAVTQFRELLARDPLVAGSAARSQSGRAGIAALRNGQGEAAVTALEAAVDESPGSAEAHRILGLAYRALRDTDRSITHLEKAVALAPDDERARVALGRALADAGRLEPAEQLLRETVQRLPASAETLWALADVYERSGRGPEAIRELESAATFPVLAGKSELYWRIAELAHRHQDYERVVDALRARARLIANDPRAHKDLGLAYSRLGRQNAALVELSMASLLGFEDAESLAGIGQIHLNAGRLELAERVLRRAIALDAESPQARYALGSTLLRLGRTDEGQQQLAEFKRLRSAALEDQRLAFRVETMIHEADLLTRAGKLDQAVRQLETVLTIDARPDVYRQLAELYERLGRTTDAARARAASERSRQQPPEDVR